MAIEKAGFPSLDGGLFLGNYGSLSFKFNASNIVNTSSENRPYATSLLILISY